MSNQTLPVPNEIPTLLRFFNEGNQSDLYKSNTFIYSSGSFLTTSTNDEEFHIIIHAHTLDRHPGNEEDSEIYFMHCPEAAQPTVTFLGVVLKRGGQLNGGPILLHYRLQTTVYNSSSRTYHTFPVTAYFKNGQRWANFPPLTTNSYVFLTGRIFGLTKEYRQLAIVTDDIHFLPRPNHHLPVTPSSTGKRKCVDRWSQRAGSQTPTKSTASSRTEPLPITRPRLYSPEVVPLDNEDEDTTQITWPATTDENEPSPPATTPPPERRSRRQRKKSYTDVLAQPDYNG
ncbi:uncharacterized protein N7473_001751 [Penicillium subrubescens]|uniref:uncharacterized protein n=1 Tax=Penicillium subrubescens TaxID=1316194 RepID=UPI0025454CF0|nr:uncharacterized protein N7473_001613 [Penicillium subrubescens]XP_057011345.1 uncharacterized protein N7473_001751 [Penicillium subrubescens]KAJ5904697.1 hypothetical protein N7473_001613 [Penicillium subrubescens]KAJ5904835.1 hypothetical protein N7473_001751 [Penicillium subrubescens]